jgi:N-methylhydantoinase A
MGRADPAPARYVLAVDVGGTFIDYALLDRESGRIVLDKHLSSRSALAAAFVEGLQRLGIDPRGLARIAHGTTVAINALLEERGARVGLLTTRGFRDVLALGRGGRPEIYNWLYQPPSPLVPRALRREVDERRTPQGEVVRPIDPEEVDREVDVLVGAGVEAIAVCFLHAYADPTHELRALERIRARYPDLPVSVSHLLVSEWREYERTSTTVLNAYVQPVFGAYVAELGSRLSGMGMDAPIAIMRSNGGMMPAEVAAQAPIHTIASGPAGGVIGAQALAEELGLRDVICADVGGTSFDVALIEDGKVLERTQTTIGRRPVVGPTLDIVSVGAGGGSIAWIDERGFMKVGPRSAGAEPGPACFGRGGQDPTVTDAHVALGRIDASAFFDARMPLQPELARKAIAAGLCEPLSLPLEDAADGVARIAEANMSYAIRTLTVERGSDPRRFVLLAYGGGGGLFAAGIAEQLEIGKVIVPRDPANFSAVGILRSDYRYDRARTKVRPLVRETAPDIAADLKVLREQAVAEVVAYGLERSVIRSHLSADVRFGGQEHTVTIDIDDRWQEDVDALLDGIRRRFVQAHRALFGHGEIDAPVEVVTCRARAIGPSGATPWPRWERAGEAEPVRMRDVYLREHGGWLPTRIFAWPALGIGQRISGPAVIEDWATTVLVPPGWAARLDEMGNLHLTVSGGAP